MRLKNAFLMLMLIMMLLLNSVLLMHHALPASAQNLENEDPFVILFDQAHGQVFNASLYDTALRTINETFQQHSDKLPPLEIHVNHDKKFSRELLAGVDLLIVTNPGAGSQANFTEKEKLALVEWYQQGKGMILLSNPYVPNDENLTGKPEVLNSLLDNNYITISGALFTVTNVDNKKYPDILIDEKHSIDSSHQILELNLEEKPEDETAVRDLLHNVSRVYTWTQSLSAQNKTILAWPTTVKKLANGNIDVPTGIPTVYGSSVVPETGFRVVLSGSSFMFSDLQENTTNKSWIELGNNLQLWINTLLWAGHFKPEEVLAASQNVLNLPELAFFGAILFIGAGFIFLGLVYRFVGPFPLEVIGVDEAARRLQGQLNLKREEKKATAATGDKKALLEQERKKPPSTAPSSGRRSRRRQQLRTTSSKKKKK